MVDYLVVGLGLAGISFCEVLDENKKTFLVVSDASQTSSTVAGGLYNPIILKRFTLAWEAHEQLRIALPFYKKLEEKFQTKFDYKIPVRRRFASIEEQNLWFEASDKIGLKNFLAAQIIKNTNPTLDAPYGYGEVLETGRIDTKKLLSVYEKYISDQTLLLQETFDYNLLEVFQSHVDYKGIKARHLVFATGFGLKDNPYFDYLPLNGTKGELLTIKAPKLKEQCVIKSSVFIIPLGEDLYRIGATYHWKDKTNLPTANAKEELLEKLDLFLKCDYEVVDHLAGIRPTVIDRRPLVGMHPKNANMSVLNGFGSRGVMLAPYASQQLYNCIERAAVLNPEMDISRFTKKYFNL